MIDVNYYIGMFKTTLDYVKQENADQTREIIELHKQQAETDKKIVKLRHIIKIMIGVFIVYVFMNIAAPDAIDTIAPIIGKIFRWAI